MEIGDKYDTQQAKADKGKDQITLVPTQIIRDIAKIRMYGNQKYHKPYNWIMVEKDRYKDALMRHLLAYLDDDKSVDKESGMPHLWHAACNLAFLCEMDRDDWEEMKARLLDRDKSLKKDVIDITTLTPDDDFFTYQPRKIVKDYSAIEKKGN